jgi:hypothetical protein
MQQQQSWFERHLDHDITFIANFRKGLEKGRLVRYTVNEIKKINGHIAGYDGSCRVAMANERFPVVIWMDSLRGCDTCKTISVDE